MSGDYAEHTRYYSIAKATGRFTKQRTGGIHVCASLLHHQVRTAQLLLACAPTLITGPQHHLTTTIGAL